MFSHEEMLNVCSQKVYMKNHITSQSTHCHNRTPQARWLKQQKFISHSSGVWEFQDQGSDNGLQAVAISLCAHMTYSLRTCWGEIMSSLVSLLKGHQTHYEDSTLITSFNPNYLPKSPSPNTIILGVLRLQHMNLGGGGHKHIKRVYNN